MGHVCKEGAVYEINQCNVIESNSAKTIPFNVFKDNIS